MSKHTPGPWIGTQQDEKRISIKAIFLERLGISLGFINTDDPERLAEAEANARLIAAAPELLSALQDMVKWFGSYPEFVPSEDHYKKYRAAIENANAAIAKATGAAPSTPSQKAEA